MYLYIYFDHLNYLSKEESILFAETNLLVMMKTKKCYFLGGLAAVMYLDTLMGFVMVGGAATMSYLGISYDFSFVVKCS